MHVQLIVEQVLAAPMPDPTAVAPPGLQEIGGQFLGWMKWILRACGVGGLLACGIMMTVGRRNRSSFAADGASGIPWVLGGLTLGSMAVLLAGAFA
ncbi:hypothetical protein [Actinoplanes sp. L3-i22]|uniref:hypothetical protein n=1 Tax=Actinoplanes sp. L3-i22 TaxID=2836373 RepID=UPI001C77DCE9|nr:hypothetical protein [Actinoplanes sp. L3-i22]BCY10974.1 hypothetical protein L3i22_060620 [Actinoplanes sp. L3-i22]